MAKRTLTLDIKEHGIDWVLLRSGLGNVTIEKSGQLVCRIDEAAPKDAITAIKSLRKSVDAPGLTCIAAIESRGLYSRSIGVPFHDRRKVRQILPLELEATLPVAIDDLALDFRLFGNNSTTTALAAAMPMVQVDFYRNLLRKTGLDPRLITFSGLPAATLLAAGPKGEKTALLIDGDTDHTTLFVVGNYQLLCLRSWTPPITGSDMAGRLKSAIDQTLEAISHISPEAVDIHAIYLTPRGARHYPPEHLATRLDLEIEVFDLPGSLNRKISGELSGGYGQGALALGLYEHMADKGLNLFRSAFPLKQFLQQHRKKLIRAGIMTTILTAIFLVNVFIDIRRNDAKVQLLKAEVEAVLKQNFPETRNIVNPLQQMIVSVRAARNDDLSATLGSQPPKIDVLLAISQSLPSKLDIHVSHLVAGSERVQISGTTGDFEAVNEAKGHLENAEVFNKITIISANMDQTTGRVRFKLSADLHSRP